MAKNRKIDLVLALGGGGARGLAHLGVLQVLDRERIPIDFIVGTSVGSVVGASYALHPDALEITRRALAYFRGSSFKSNPFKKVLFHSENVEQNFFRSLIMSIKKSYVFSSLIRKPSIFSSERLYSVISDLIPEKDFQDTQIPFAVPSIDIRTGNEVLLTEGSIRKALLASCSLPGFFPPVEHDGKLLTDAGVIGPVPVSICRQLEPRIVVAVDISNRLEPVERIDIGLDAIMRVEAIAGRRINDMELARADVVIQPSIGHKFWSDFSGYEELVDSGIAAAQPLIPRIRELLRGRPRFWKISSGSV